MDLRIESIRKDSWTTVVIAGMCDVRGIKGNEKNTIQKEKNRKYLYIMISHDLASENL